MENIEQKDLSIPRIRLRNKQELDLITQYRKALDNSGVNPEKVGITKVWQTMGGDVRLSLTMKNEEEDALSYMDLRQELFEEMCQYSPEFKYEYERKAVVDPHLVIIDPADIHIGKYASKDETGGYYNRDIAYQRTMEGVRALIDMTTGFNIDQVILVIGNDILHTDDPFTSKTTSGTLLDGTDGTWHENFRLAKDLYCSLIEDLLPLAPVHVVFCPSNHDFQSGFMLADTIHSWFHKHPDVTFDTGIRHRKYYKYGLNMLEFDHGDGHKLDDTPMLLATDDPIMWSQTKFRYSYKHHFHSKRDYKVFQKSYEEFHVAIEYLRSPSSPDAWHDRNGFINLPAVEAFVHSREFGQVARFTKYVR